MVRRGRGLFLQNELDFGASYSTGRGLGVASCADVTENFSLRRPNFTRRERWSDVYLHVNGSSYPFGGNTRLRVEILAVFLRYSCLERILNLF